MSDGQIRAENEKVLQRLMQEKSDTGQSAPTPKISDDQIRAENEKVLQRLMQEKSNTGQSAPTPKISDDQIRAENENIQSKALAEANSAGPEVKTYYSPDTKFSIQESPDHVEFVDKAAERRTTIGVIGHMMGKPLFSKDNNGFVVPVGTASMGVWPEFYKRDNSGGIFKISPPLDTNDEPDLMWDSIDRLLQIEPTRMFIVVDKWDGGPTAEISVWISPASRNKPVHLILDIQRSRVSRRNKH